MRLFEPLWQGSQLFGVRMTWPNVNWVCHCSIGPSFFWVPFLEPHSPSDPNWMGPFLRGTFWLQAEHLSDVKTFERETTRRCEHDGCIMYKGLVAIVLRASMREAQGPSTPAAQEGNLLKTTMAIVFLTQPSTSRVLTSQLST